MTPSAQKYADHVKEHLSHTGNNAPHCDELVLHAPEDDCVVCNERPEWQQLRRQLKVAFTGRRVLGWDVCPAEQRRPLQKIHRWYGNVPCKDE